MNGIVSTILYQRYRMYQCCCIIGIISLSVMYHLHMSLTVMVLPSVMYHRYYIAIKG